MGPILLCKGENLGVLHIIGFIKYFFNVKIIKKKKLKLKCNKFRKCTDIFSNDQYFQ